MQKETNGVMVGLDAIDRDPAWGRRDQTNAKSDTQSFFFMQRLGAL